MARSDSAGNVISRTSYEPYGRTASGVTPTIGFTGHVNDADTGLVHMQQRYYDPVAGRFLSVDPVTTNENNGSNFNRYVYAVNDPYGYVDPDGREPDPVTQVVVVKGKREKRDPFFTFSAPTPTREQVADRKFAASLNDGPIQSIAPECILPQLRFACAAKDMSTDESVDVSNAIGAMGAIKGAQGVRRKPGPLGQPKGTDALRRENKQANDVDRDLGLKPGTTHAEISGLGLKGYTEIKQYMKDLGHGK